METGRWSQSKLQRLAVSILKFGYYLTGIASILMFILPFYAWFVWLEPRFGYLMSGPEMIYVAVVAIVYGLFFLIVTALLVVLHGLGEKLLVVEREPVKYKSGE